jgi:sugar lactone lactonase YvrE
MGEQAGRTALNPMSSRHLLLRVILLFEAAFIFSANVISAIAGNLTFDTEGNLYELAEHCVSKFTVDGSKSTVATGLKGPHGLSIDSKGNLFVSDAVSNAIYKITPDGKKSRFATGINSTGMAFDRSDNLFVSAGDSIFKFTSEGLKSTFVSGLGNPIDLAFDGDGNLFVVDMAVTDARVGRWILRFSHDGTKSGFVSGLEDPARVAVDGAGNLFVTEVTAADASSHAILQFRADGTKNVFASKLGFTRASGLACDHSGNVFVSNDHSILKFDSHGTASTFASDWVSPDKQWEYRCVDGKWPQIVKAGTTQVGLDLLEDQSVQGETDATVVWAPDSKRFAFNYSPPHAAHSTYKTIAIYQLGGDDKWVALPLPLDQTSHHSQLAQLAKQHLPTREPDPDTLVVRNWPDANTAILYAYSAWESGSRILKASFLFTLKFDAGGNSKIVKAQRMSEN